MTTLRRFSDAGDRRHGDRRMHGRRLTDRQASILEFVASGLENKEIAHRLGISEQAVKEHVSNLLRLLSAPNRAALADAAATRRFVGTSDLDPGWLSVLFLDAPALIALLEGPEHRFVAVNDAYRRAAGPRELEGRAIREVFPELNEAGIVRYLDEAFETGEPRSAVDVAARWYRQPEADAATPGRVTCLVHPMRTADGSVGGVVLFAIDVTAEHDAHEAVRQRSAEWRAILAQLPSGVIVVDSAGIVREINDAGQRILQVTFDPDGKTAPWQILELRDLKTRAPLDRGDRPLMRALAGRESPERDYLGVNALTGEEMVLRISAAPLFELDGTVRGATAVFTLISRP